MFDCCRVPGTQSVDWSVSYAGSPNPHNDLGHIIVMRKNRFWKIKAEIEGKVLGMSNLIGCGLFFRDSHVEDRFSKMNALQRHLLQSLIILISPLTILVSVPQPIPIYI